MAANSARIQDHMCVCILKLAEPPGCQYAAQQYNDDHQTAYWGGVLLIVHVTSTLNS